MLVYERLYHGSLDRLLHGRSDGGPAIDWSTRIKVAISAARGLAFLHDEGPFQVIVCHFILFLPSLDFSRVLLMQTFCLYFDRLCTMSFPLQIFKLTRTSVQSYQATDV